MPIRPPYSQTNEPRPQKIDIYMKIFCLLLCLLLSSMANAESTLACQTGGDDPDPCIYFNDDVIFLSNGENAQLSLRGKIHDLKLISEIQKIKQQAHANLIGDVLVITYANPEISARITEEIIDTDCYFLSEEGDYKSTESCCGGNTTASIEITRKNTREEYQTEYGWGF